MPSSLKGFYLNEAMRNDVKTYLIDFLKVQAIDKTFKREDTSAVAEAKEILDKAFSDLDILFAPESQVKELKNEAR
jgi:hypothetical protein